MCATFKCHKTITVQYLKAAASAMPMCIPFYSRGLWQQAQTRKAGKGGLRKQKENTYFW